MKTLELVLTQMKLRTKIVETSSENNVRNQQTQVLDRSLRIEKLNIRRSTLTEADSAKLFLFACQRVKQVHSDFDSALRSLSDAEFDEVEAYSIQLQIVSVFGVSS
jgi:hypothetical protein